MGGGGRLQMPTLCCAVLWGKPVCRRQKNLPSLLSELLQGAPLPGCRCCLVSGSRIPLPAAVESMNSLLTKTSPTTLSTTANPKTMKRVSQRLANDPLLLPPDTEVLLRGLRVLVLVLLSSPPLPSICNTTLLLVFLKVDDSVERAAAVCRGLIAVQACTTAMRLTCCCGTAAGGCCVCYCWVLGKDCVTGLRGKRDGGGCWG